MKLINSQNAKFHDYSNRQKKTIAYDYSFSGEKAQIKFKDFFTTSLIGKIRTCLFVNVGDFCFFTMESGKIGVY